MIMKISEIKKEASKISGRTRRAIAYRADRLKELYGPFSDVVAYGIVAHRIGVEVSKFVDDKEILELIREQNDRINIIEAGTARIETRTVVKNKLIKIGEDINLSDPILDSKVISDAKEMTKVYAQIYVFENSIRAVINLVLSKKIGKDWWNRSNVNKTVFDNVKGRIDKEEGNPYHGKRGAHPIYYTDMADLSYLIRKFWNNYFSDIFPRLEWVTEKIEQVSLSRNIVDHHNPLSKSDQQRLKVIFTDWNNQLKGKKNKILSD